MDGSRLENGAIGAAIAFKADGSWTKEGSYLGNNKEVFDAEVWAICRALETLNSRNEENTSYTVFSDAQAAISRVLHDQVGPGQTLAIRAITTATSILERGNTIALRWTPSHMSAEGNEQADEEARRAAEERENRVSSQYLGRRAWLISRESPPKPDRRQPWSGSALDVAENEDTILQRVARCGRASIGPGRSWPAGSSSYCQDTRQWQTT